MNDVVDAILTLIAYNAKITGFDRGSYNARIAAKDVGNKTQNDHKIPTIRDIVAKMVAINRLTYCTEKVYLLAILI
jgi:hypothetical protein